MIPIDQTTVQSSINFIFYYSISALDISNSMHVLGILNEKNTLWLFTV